MRMGTDYPITRTSLACSPFCPWLTSNSTFWFSSRLLYPDPAIALKWTKTSAPPPSWVMKPKPFSPLNHFTVPVATSVAFLETADQQRSAPAMVFEFGRVATLPCQITCDGHQERSEEALAEGATLIDYNRVVVKRTPTPVRFD